MRWLTRIAVVVLILVIYGLIGTLDYRDQQDTARETRQIMATAPRWAVSHP